MYWKRLAHGATCQEPELSLPMVVATALDWCQQPHSNSIGADRTPSHQLEFDLPCGLILDVK